MTSLPYEIWNIILDFSLKELYKATILVNKTISRLTLNKLNNKTIILRIKIVLKGSATFHCLLCNPNENMSDNRLLRNCQEKGHCCFDVSDPNKTTEWILNCPHYYPQKGHYVDNNDITINVCKIDLMFSSPHTIIAHTRGNIRHYTRFAIPIDQIIKNDRQICFHAEIMRNIGISGSDHFAIRYCKD